MNGDQPGGRSNSRTTYDVANRPTSQQDATGAVTTLTYDGNGNVTSVKDPSGAVTSYVRDRDDNLSATVDPVQRRTARTLDPNGNLAREDPPGGGVRTWEFDADDQLRATVDPRGNVAGCGCAGTYTTRYEYDPRGNLIKVTDPQGSVISYGYDTSGNRTSERDARGHTTTYGYDLVGRLLTVLTPDAASQNKPLRYSYFPNTGLLEKRTAPEGGVTSYTWNDLGQLSARTNAIGTWTYAYDYAGQLRTEVTPADAATPEVAGDGRISYTYDDAQRLRRVGYSGANGGWVSYAYDAAGRRTEVRDPDSRVAYDYTTHGLIESITQSPVNSGGTVLPGSTWAYTYFPDGALKGVTRPDGSTESRTYGADGRPAAMYASGRGTHNYTWNVAATSRR